MLVLVFKNLGCTKKQTGKKLKNKEARERLHGGENTNRALCEMRGTEGRGGEEGGGEGRRERQAIKRGTRGKRRK